MFNLEKIENLYLLILRYVIVVVASIAILTSTIMLLTGFAKSMTGDPNLPTENYRSSANSSVATSDIVLSWVPESEKESLKSNKSVIYKFCPSCGFNNEKLFKFCPGCGSALLAD